ncbi:MAG: DUF805 domain-containing protein [Actinomycetales bacterium]|jgi:uncharacterized membrane protein YhaH (DUF805 family)
MGFGEAISSGLKNLTNFSGRASRSEFWWYVLFIWIVSIILHLILNAIGLNGNSAVGTGFFIVYVLQVLALIAIGARRLHDTGKSGWLELLWIIPCVGPIILIIFWVQGSQPGDNQYGSGAA